MFLREIANIRPGYIFRARPDYSDKGQYQIIRLQDIKGDNTIDWADLARINLDSVKPDSILKAGDILFKSRGRTHFATVVDKTEGNVIAVSQFFILRPTQNVLPEFLAWYINQNEAQQYIAQSSAGTAIKHISKLALGKLEVPVPDMETQRRIAELYKLSQKEKSLTEQILRKREQLINAVMLKMTVNTLTNRSK